MPLADDPTDLLTSEAQLLPLAEVLNLPPDRLLGVDADALAALATLGIRTIFDLAMSSVFDAAVKIERAADDAANAMNRFGRPVSDLLKPGIADSIAVADLRNESIDILADIADAAAVQNALGVVTVRDLSVYPPFRAAREILNRAFFPEQLEAFDPESPADLVPKSGEFPTERVQYTSLVLDEILRPDNAPPLIDIASPQFTPIDATRVTDADFGFSTLGLGMLLTLNQSWFMQGVTLGHLLHSMALAAGESTRIAVIDWSRKTSAGQTEQIGETEDLSQDTSRNRSISEVTQAVAREAQSGFSHTESTSTTKQAGASGGISIGPFGGGVSASISKTSTSADSYATSAGSREVGASMLQNASDRTHQHAHAARTRRASVVREVSQTEHEAVSTRVITNYNHMHALTVQYYEVLQIYRTETALARCDRVVFVPFRLIDFANVDLLRRFRAALVDAALTPAVRDALVNFDMLELVPERRVVFPGLGGSIAEVLENPRVVIRPARLARRRPPDEEEPAPEGESPEPPAPEEPPTRPPRPGRPDDVAGTLWETAASKLSSFFGTPSVRRNSQSLFVPSDVQVEEGAVQSTVRTIKLVFVLRDGTRIVDLSASVALSEVDRIALLGSNPAADTPATAVLALSRNGVVFPLELPTVTVEKGAQETKLIDVRAAGADVNLVQHLMDNRLHYSQAVFRSLDPAMIAGLLAPFSITLNGRSFPLVQVAEPIPLRIVGNALAFKINTDPVNDQEWRDFMASRGLVIGQSKVDVVPLSSGGIFAEAVLGRFNCAEKLDMSRFFNWQDSPIPIQPTDIAAIQTGSRARDENLTPGQFSQPLVSISQPAALPDPTGLAGALAAIQNGAMFRDMSGLADTIKLATETAKLSAAGATSVGQQAGEAMKTAVSADTERRKIAADLEKAKVQAATDLAKAKLGKSIQDKNITEAGAVVNKEEELKKKQQEQAKAGGGKASGSGGTSGGGGTGGGTSGGSGSAGGGGSSGPSAPRSTGNSALDRIIGNDESLRSFIGLAPDSPVPTPAVTDEGVPLQDWDFIGGGYSLFYQETNAGPRELAAGAQIEEIIAADFWSPTKAEDFRSLLLGDRKVLAADFGDLLFALALVPAGSMRALNIVAYAKNNRSLALTRDFIYTKSDESFTIRDAEPTTLSTLDLQKLISLAGGGPISTSDGDVKLADVRKAFAVDGEVRIFNLETALSPEYVQAMANFFQVRAAGFVKKQVRVAAEVIATTENGEPVLDKKASLQGDPAGQTVDFLVHLLEQDRAQSGLFTAFPRRG